MERGHVPLRDLDTGRWGLDAGTGVDGRYREKTMVPGLSSLQGRPEVLQAGTPIMVFC